VALIFLNEFIETPSAPCNQSGSKIMARKAREKTPDAGPDRRSSNVPGTYLGFSLQTTRAYARLMQADLDDWVCLEVFEDVGVQHADGTRTAEQNKSNLTYNPLSNRSLDFWKTLGNWVDSCLNGDLDPDRTFFEIYTSNPAGGQIAQMFHDARTRGQSIEAIEQALHLLTSGQTDRQSEQTDRLAPHISRITSADREVVAKIVMRFSFSSGAGSPHEELRALTMRELVSLDNCEDVIRWGLGWVKRETDLLLEKRLPAKVSKASFHAAMLNYVRTYDRLNILRSFAGPVTEEEIQAEVRFRTYVRQLELISMDDYEVYEAINDYLKAATDRTVWSERGMTDESGLEKYAEELCRSWRNKMDRITIGHSHRPETDRGRLLYRDCIEHQLPLDGIPTPPHFTRGSWHALADDLVVGWHPRYQTELQNRAGPGPSEKAVPT
jgi:hypothetical protein